MSSILRKVENAINPERREGVPPPSGPVGTTAAEPRTVPATGHHHGHHHGGQQEAAYAADSHYTTATGPRAGLTSAKGPQSGPLPGPAPNTAGPHRYDLLNKLDPSVDSNMASGSAVAGNPPAGKHAHNHHAAAAAPAVAPPPQQQYAAGGVPEGTHGPHKSRLANALDPRVDSDLDGGRAPAQHYQQQQHHHHHHGMGAAAAPPAPAMMNPGESPATGPAPHTAGPHRSDLMNKLDPSVDSTGMGTKQQHVRRGI